ncbi:MAG: MBL fold metallo-hydrolase [Candidatus Bathyarchaeota archaeon]|nr:MAG: MBL fold metallo-hydrolase [Candidatus Bathyarchaeota archaeon]
MPEIADGVFQLEIPMRYNPLGRTYSYLLLDSCTLIDTGVQSKEAFKAMLEQLKGLGMNVKDLEQIILTHLHRDHTGLVDRIRKVSEVRILAHEEAVEIQKRWAALGRRGYEETRDETKMWGGGGLLDILSRYEQAFRRPRPSLKIDGTVADGATLELEGSMLHVIWTPGHSRDHICIHDQGRELLFSGDHVFPKITSHVSLHTFQKGDPLADYLRSLERLRGLGFSIVLPGHEGVFEDLEGRINQLERHHEIRCGEI